MCGTAKEKIQTITSKMKKQTKTKHIHTHKGERKNSVKNTELSGRFLLN